MADGQDVQTLKMNVSDVREATSFARARTAGVNRLLRSNTSSIGSVPVSTHGHRSSHDTSKSPTARRSNVLAKETVGNATESATNMGPHVVSLPTRSGQGDDDDGSIEPKWSHVVLKLTGFSDDDTKTSFQFDTRGGGIGHGPANVASIPADALLAETDHARVVYRGGRFYVANGAPAHDTFVRLSPRNDDDDMAEQMQWPLEPHVAFRVGTSDFLVTACHAASSTLDVSALSGKLTGTHFHIGRHGAGIGRSADNAIHTRDGELSRHHAAIWFDALTHQFYLVDLHSTNGTFMKLVGRYHEPYRLELGDELLVAQTCLTITRYDVGIVAAMGARAAMEDAHTIIHDLNIPSLGRYRLHYQSFFAVYDGHGGHEASVFLSQTLHHQVRAALSTTTADEMPTSASTLHAWLPNRLIEAFERTDANFLHDAARPQAGSTATTALIAGTLLVVANVGDSRTILSRHGVAERLSNDHKPSRADEAQRIRATGGFVIHGRIMGELAVSRAFGDAPFKTFDRVEPRREDGDDAATTLCRADGAHEWPVNPHDILKGPLVIATPEITVTELTDECEFLVLASDGLYDVVDDQEAVDFLRQQLVERGDVQRAVEALVEHAIVHQRSTDNVTCMVVMFKESKAFEEKRELS